MNSHVFFVCVVIFAVNHRQKLQAYAAGIFEVRIDNDVKVRGQHGYGGCCEIVIAKSRNNGCEVPCQTHVKICLSHGDSVDENSCTFGSDECTLAGRNSLDHNQRSSTAAYTILEVPFNFTWSGSFTLLVEITQEGSSKLEGKNIAHLVKRGILFSGEEWNTETQSLGGALFRFSYRVKCSNFNYGPGCEIFCRPRNDQLGHWTCDANGKKICSEGWKKSSYCMKPQCRDGCHQQNGYCQHPGECLCRQGWQGPLCNKCIQYPGCKHGTCERSFECKCHDGWGGMLCNLDLNFCIHHKPCKNNALCRNSGMGSFSCECLPGFTGRRCEVMIEECNEETCMNGGKCAVPSSSHICECLDGYTGQTCEISTICSRNLCRNGATCTVANNRYHCECRPGYEGVYCDKPICAQDVCYNNGTCEIINHQRICNCQRGFVGRFCRNVDYCTSNPCPNNDTCWNHDDGYYCQCEPGSGNDHCTNTMNSPSKRTNFIVVPPGKIGTRVSSQIATIGILSVLVVILVIGLVVCWTHSEKASYWPGVIKKTPKLSENTGCHQRINEPHSLCADILVSIDSRPFTAIVEQVLVPPSDKSFDGLVKESTLQVPICTEPEEHFTGTRSGSEFFGTERPSV